MKFTGKKYITKGVYISVPFTVQQHIWVLIEHLRRKGVVLDYLLVVDIEIMNALAKITVSQEEPKYNFHNDFDITDTMELLKIKLYIIDSDEYITMMLSDEY